MTETLSLQDAASRMGVSTRTLRRRIKAGQLAGRQVSTPQGYRWLVDIPDFELVPASQSEEWRQVVEERDAYREIIAELRTDLADIKTALAELTATRQVVNAAPAGQLQQTRYHDVTEPPRRSWWRRFLYGPV